MTSFTQMALIIANIYIAQTYSENHFVSALIGLGWAVAALISNKK